MMDGTTIASQVHTAVAFVAFVVVLAPCGDWGH